MRFEQLEYLLEVATTNSIVKASKKLHTSQQNISYALKTLEEELHVKIFERSSTGLLLTPEGRKVKKMATEIVERTHNLQSLFNPTEVAVDYTLREDVYCLTTPAFSHYLLSVIYRLKPLYPQITFHLFETDADSGWRTLRDNPHHYQLALLESMEDNARSGELFPYYKCTLIKKSQLAFLASPHHPLARINHPSLSVVEKYPIVFFTHNEGKQHTMYDRLLSAQGYNVDIAFFTNSPSAYFDAITTGHAVGLITEYIYRSNASNTISVAKILPLKEKISVFHLLMTANQLTPAGQILLDHFYDLFKTYDAELIDINFDL